MISTMAAQQKRARGRVALLCLAALASTCIGPVFLIPRQGLEDRGGEAAAVAVDASALARRSVIGATLLASGPAWAGTSKEDKAWLDAKGKEAGVVTLESGLMYKVLEEGQKGT